ncbi:NADH dehydrogenase [ubiquinone] flavoprotein 1, mitochondrial-like [Calliphora vicina]|uniref:NADH dehydrogenase [ubiquinone] flavoprotein 1, mitochondrial-like n=1 Tax=Calliphora vicina TaxID=7373 RepID=UPI00325A4BEA
MYLKLTIISTIFKNTKKCWCNNSIFKNYSSQIADKFEPLADDDRIFTNLYGRHDWHLNAALTRGDWHKTREIIVKGPAWIINELEVSGVRGRGGAGFLLAKKLRYMQKVKAEPPRYVVVNGAEGEPGTCKDREILRHEPQKIIEGALLVGRAISAKAAIVFIRARFYNEACNLQMAIAEAYENGLVGANACGSGFDFDIFIQRGGDIYIAGEETALLNCLMGSEARPRRKPPYPSEKGIYDRPTTLLNVETVALIPSICRRGSKWFANLGCPPHSPGSKLFNISGHVERPCTVEENLGIPLRDLIERHAGGVCGGWDNLLAVMPGGSSTPLLPKDLCNDLKLDSESLKTVNSGLGTGAVIVIDKSQDILEVTGRTLWFYKEGSCHQCSRCRGLSMWAYEYCKQFQLGIGQRQEIDWLWEISKWAAGHTICSFSEGNACAVQGLLRHFRKTIEKSLH